MRNSSVVWLSLFCIFMLGSFVHLLQIDLAWRVSNAVEHHVEASELGEPDAVCTEKKGCFSGWHCDDGDKLFAGRADDERVFAFASPPTWRVFFVLIGNDGHVKQYAACGS